MRPIEAGAGSLSILVFCATLAASFVAAAQSPLSPDKAFRFSARPVDAHTVEARFTIADGYYLYRDKIHFSIEPASAGLETPRLPEGQIKEDQFFGRVETYRRDVVVHLAIKDVMPGQQVVIAAQSQGCADIGLCYPPTVQRATLVLPMGSAVPSAAGEIPKKSWFNE